MSFAPASIEDAHEIVALTIEANVAADQAQPERWADVFIEDGIFESSFDGVFKGRQALQAFAAEFTARVKGRHFTSNNVVEVDGDRARHQCYLMFVTGGQIAGVGQYVDELVRVNGRWKLAHRRFAHDRRQK